MELAKTEILLVKGFPRLAGVANGAMMIRVKPVLDTDYDTLLEVLKHKGDGTSNLKQLFEGEDFDFSSLFPRSRSSWAASAGRRRTWSGGRKYSLCRWPVMNRQERT